MAKKNKVTVNEDMIKGIMAADVPIYGKDTPIEAQPEPTMNEGDIPNTTGTDKNAAKQKRRKDDKDSYSSKFLGGGNVLNRQQAYISKDNYLFIKRFLSVVAPEISMTKYIDDILTSHFEQYKEEIDGLYSNQVNNPLYK